VANAIAPEHLELLVDDAEALLPLVRHAGAVFCGPLAPASIGDYLAWPNHVLPTYGTARFAEALRVDDFRKHIHVVRAEPGARAAALGAQAAVIARAEGLEEHARSLDRRAGSGGPGGEGVAP
jgi:histidinol dehydrogenase